MVKDQKVLPSAELTEWQKEEFIADVEKMIMKQGRSETTKNGTLSQLSSNAL